MRPRHISRNSKFKNLVSADVSHPFRRAVVVVESKLKYLEQRKKRIELYQEAQRNGKKLTSFQLSALSKLGQVTRMLEDVRDVHEQFCEIAAKAARAQERQKKKEVPDGNQQDLAKIRDVLMIQYILQNMRQDTVREDFLTGQNGAICLTENDLECLDEFYVEISLMNGMEEDVPPFEDQLQQSAEHLLALVNGKVKEINGTTYAKLKELIAAIQSCGYFDYIVEELTTEPILQQNLKEEPEVTIGEFVVSKEDIEPYDYVVQQQKGLPKGTPKSCASIDVAESSEPFRKKSSPPSGYLFVCSICQRKFCQKPHLKRHMDLIHSRKPASCTICGKTFSQEYDLKTHMGVHAGESQYTCEKCNATFLREEYLQRHMFDHSEKKPFSCSMCEASFSRPSALKGHMQKHTYDQTKEFFCTICDAAFTRKDKLKSHMLKKHVAEKFCCTVCSMMFTEKSQLDQHMLSHKKTTFSCPVCRAKFFQKSQLGEHILLHL